MRNGKVYRTAMLDSKITLKYKINTLDQGVFNLRIDSSVCEDPHPKILKQCKHNIFGCLHPSLKTPAPDDRRHNA